MDMCVDQTRHEHLALAVNDLCLWRRDRTLRDVTNSFPFHQDMHVLADLRRRAVPEGTVLEKWSRRTAPCCLSAVGFRPALPTPDKHLSAHPAFHPTMFGYPCHVP